MRRVLPKSLNGILWLGLTFLAVPLLFSVLYATVQMRRFATASELLVTQSVQSARLSQNLNGQIPSLEGAARRYQVTRDAQFLSTYIELDGNFSRIIEQLQRRLDASEIRGAVDELMLEQARMRARISALSAPDDVEAAVALSLDFQPLNQRVERIATLINQHVDGELASLRDQTETARRRLIWEASILVPLVLLALLAFSLGMGRPLRQIDRAITDIGSGKLANPIEVRGPVDLVRLGAQLEWLRLRLLELAQERNRFLRHMSHELKTPLANIREGTELLMDGAVGELGSGQREVAGILQDNGIKLQRMIENLLSFSAWQSNTLHLDLSEFRLRPLIKQVLENQQLTLVAQRVRLDVQVGELVLYADRGKIRLILENLLSNAIKYSPRGGTIHVIAHADGNQLQLEVADDGVGIPEADRTHVFDAFFTGRSPSGRVKGTGIGLSVVNEFVNVHGGGIQLVDGQYTGAHFRVKLPMRVAEAAPGGDAPAGKSPSKRSAHAA
jgi:two-component system sensor histidine kinase GlrK